MSGLDKDYAGKVHGQNLDATTEENEKVVKELGFSSHGLVIRSADGKVVWKQPDHKSRSRTCARSSTAGRMK